MKKSICLSAMLVLACCAFNASAETAGSVVTQVAVPMPKARQVALQARPGQVISETTEVREGGSGTRYTFKINTGEVTYEVGVDANTGLVLVNAVEPRREGDATSSVRVPG